MKALTPYLFFHGNCKEAMEFYQHCFGGTLQIMTNKDAPKDACPIEVTSKPDEVMHACLSQGDFMLMASDNPMSIPKGGDHISLNINCTTKEQTEELFAALSADGVITMPLADTFWESYFGMLIDKYGIHWMLNCPLASAKV